MFSNIFKKTQKKEDILKALEAAEEYLLKMDIPELSKLIKLLSGISKSERNKLVGSGIFPKDLKYTDDVEFFKDYKDLLLKLADIIPDLEDKIETELPDEIPLETREIKDANIRTAVNLVDMILFLAVYTPDLVSYTVDILYLDKNVNLLPEETIENYKGLIKILPVMLNVVAYLGSEPKQIVENIGNLPVAKNRSGLMASVITKYFRSELNVKNNFTVGLFNRLISWGTDVDVKDNFVGNPIYHLRKFLVELELAKLERLKDKKRLLELKLLELKNELNNKPNDPKLQKQIEYYENKINQVDEKINAIMDV
jgi:hypothetical protein